MDHLQFKPHHHPIHPSCKYTHGAGGGSQKLAPSDFWQRARDVQSTHQSCMNPISSFIALFFPREFSFQNDDSFPSLLSHGACHWRASAFLFWSSLFLCG